MRSAGSRPASAAAARARSMPHATRTGSAPRANVIRSAVRALKSMTLGPDAAMSSGTLPAFAESSQRILLSRPSMSMVPPARYVWSRVVRSKNSRDRHRRQPEMEQGGVAATGAQHEPSAGDLVHGGGRGRQRCRVAGVDVGHAGGQLDVLGAGGHACEHHERIGAEILRVGEGDAVPAGGLGTAGPFDRALDDRNRHRPEFHGARP